MPATDRTEAPRAEIEAEHRILRTGCGLIDRSQMGKLALTGAGAAEFLTGQLTNDIEALGDGEGCYAAFLTHKGKMLGDLRVLAIGEPPGELFLITERACLQTLFDTIRRFKIGYEVQLQKRTLEAALLSLIGPDARTVCLAAADTTPHGVEHSHCAAEIAGRGVRLITTAQPAGIDVICDADDREAVHDALLAAGAQPVGEAAAEVVRIEEGRPRYGVELDETVIPQEAGLNERAVSFTKGCYVGQETVARLHYKGRPNRHLRGLRLAGDAVAPGAELTLDGRVVGRLASLALSPSLGPIGLALVRREAQPGAVLAAGPDGLDAEVVELPFDLPGHGA